MLYWLFVAVAQLSFFFFEFIFAFGINAHPIAAGFLTVVLIANLAFWYGVFSRKTGRYK